MKENILLNVKTQVRDIVNQLTLDNLNEVKSALDAYFGFLLTLKGLPVIDPPRPASNFESDQAPTADRRSDDALRRQVLIEQPKETFVFERKLRGGMFPDLEDGYLIPEKMVRDIGLQHGDSVSIINSVKHDGETRYIFEIARKANIGDAPGRVEINHCYVETSSSGFLVKKSLEGQIYVDDEPFTFSLNRKDSLAYNISNGDIVDIAYYDNNPQTVKLICKHIVSRAETASAAPKKTQTKKTDDDAADEHSFPFDLSFLRNKHLVIVGSEFERANYQRAFDMLKIELTHMSGDEGKERLRAVIKKADAVIVTTQNVGHNGSVPSASLCKEYGVPFVSCDRNGVQHMLLETEKVMKRKIEQTA